MKRRIKSIKGLFGQLIHYEGDIKTGESWPGMFEGSYEHYDANGKYAGYSDLGIVADLIHHDEHGGYAGATYTGLLGEKNHYSAERGYVGETWEGLTGETTALIDDLDSGDPPDRDDFFSDDDW
jgi:hypothetical protein